MQAGIKGRREQTVTAEMSAARIGSGLVEVFATPMMVALIEQTCLESVMPYLEEGQGTVGTLVNVSHVSATPVGMRVWCESELVEVDRRRLVFKVKAYDECGLIGEGTHERFIIDNAKFMEKIKNKS
ncbi:MAG: thioesterase family protein [Bacteroidales bacterium]|nr:thioesterase family protein [Bacteroidales bacterium]